MQHRIRLICVVVLFSAACGQKASEGGGNGDDAEGGSAGPSTGDDEGGSTGSGRGGKSGSGGRPGTGGVPVVMNGGAPGTGAGGAAGEGSGGSGAGGSAGSGAGGASAPDDAGTTPDGPGTMGAGGAVAGGCGAAKFCDDFEGQMAGKAPTGMFKVESSGGGTITVDDTKFFSGKQSIVYKKAGGYPGTWLTFSNIAAMLPNNDLHGRMMMWMAQTPGGAHWDGINASGTKPGGGTATYILGGMYKNFMAVYHPGDCSTDSKTPFPAGRWACIQWQFLGSKDGKHLHKMMLDGQVVENGTQDGKQGVCAGGGGTRDWAAPVFNTLKVGYVAFGGGSGDIWIDDLAWGDQAIPCPPMK